MKFTGLESGNYTIKVKATSADKESFSDSEWAEARVSLREPDQLAAPVLSITEQDMTSFTVAWEAVENAASYKYALNDGQELYEAYVDYCSDYTTYDDVPDYLDDDEDEDEDYANTTMLNQNFNYADELKARREEKTKRKNKAEKII